jgi:hypothetical protein
VSSVKRPPAPRADCPHTKPSQLIEDHEHRCSGAHVGKPAMHMCRGCKRWFA